jgi:hypothetical protein
MQTAFELAVGVVDELVVEALSAAGIEAPPVDAVEVAHGMGLEVKIHRDQAERGRVVHTAGMTTIVCRPEPRPERYHWTVAHEIGEYMIAHSADRWSGDVLVLDGAVREWLANCFATHLLTPREWFLADCRLLDFDLWDLKQHYLTASHEVIALRTLESDIPAVVTIFDNGKQSKRLGNLCYRVPNLSSAERACWMRAAQTGHVQTQTTEEARIRVWPIHEGGWKREIVRTEWLAGWEE